MNTLEGKQGNITGTFTTTLPTTDTSLSVEIKNSGVMVKGSDKLNMNVASFPIVYSLNRVGDVLNNRKFQFAALGWNLDTNVQNTLKVMDGNGNEISGITITRNETVSPTEMKVEFEAEQPLSAGRYNIEVSDVENHFRYGTVFQVMGDMTVNLPAGMDVTGTPHLDGYYVDPLKVELNVLISIGAIDLKVNIQSSSGERLK